MKFSCQNSYLFQSYLKILLFMTFSPANSVLNAKVLQKNTGQFAILFFLTSWFMFCCLVFERKKPVFYLDSKIFV